MPKIQLQNFIPQNLVIYRSLNDKFGNERYNGPYRVMPSCASRLAPSHYEMISFITKFAIY